MRRGEPTLVFGQYLDQIAKTQEAQRAEVQARLREGLADVRALAVVPADMVDRLQAIEKLGGGSQEEVSELHEMHAALNAGLVISAATSPTCAARCSGWPTGQADLGDRLETCVRPR